LTLLVAGVVMGAFILVASAAMPSTLPQASNLIRLDAGYLAAAAFIDAAGRQGDTTVSIRQAAPILAWKPNPPAGRLPRNGAPSNSISMQSSKC
jgi:hypothetical protein